jgi:hypothetical protein
VKAVFSSSSSSSSGDGGGGGVSVLMNRDVVNMIDRANV